MPNIEGVARIARRDAVAGQIARSAFECAWAFFMRQDSLPHQQNKITHLGVVVPLGF
jgi:hypothetical protein